MSKNSTSKIPYQAPDPFVLPTIEQRVTDDGGFFGSLFGGLLPPTLIPREGLNYSASVLEEAMKAITDEQAQRPGNAAPQWKKYKTGTDGGIGFDVFENPKVDGSILADVPVEFFPLIVRDIQDEIDRLIGDANVPDTRASFLARIFANNTTTNVGITFNTVTKLPTIVNINTTGGTISLLAIDRAKNGLWPFTPELVGSIVPVKGVLSTDPTKRNANISQTAGQIEVTDPNFAQSPYGAVTASGVPGTKGIKMRSSDLTVWDRKNVANSSLGVGAGKEDPDMGYGYLSSVPHMVHQLRYQPPSVETFPNNVAVRQYASNIFSNTTPNLPWVLSLPIETQIGQNWGFWLIKGNVGVTGSAAFLRAFNNPSAAAGAAGQCPFSVFFPPPSSNCGCGTGDSAYFIWHSQNSGFIWNQLFLFQSGRAKTRFIGPNTRMRIVGGTSGGAGSGDVTQGFFGIGIRTTRISSVNVQPFHYVIRQNNGSRKNDPSLPDTTLDIGIMEEMNRIHGGGVYDIGGVDAIEAIQILVQTRASSNWTCDAEDGPGGSFLPASCASIEVCSAGDMSATVSSLEIYEPTLVGDPVDDYK